VGEPRVLIVEDEAAARELIEEILAEDGYDIHNAETGQEALRQADGEVDVVLLDILLPDMNGFDLVTELQGHDSPPQIVAVSGMDEVEYLQRAVASGVDDFIRKPISPTELRARVRAAVQRYGSQQSLIKDREFFRKAAAEEERLSSLVLDHNASLREANERIQRLNEDLEQANHELEELAANDPLSGLLNRRSLFKKIDADLERTRRHAAALTAILVDIDDFKAVNDTYGHVCGDHVIRELGGCMQRTLRRYDYAGRYGGEEFMMVLLDTDEASAAVVAGRLLDAVRAIDFDCDGREFPVTVSVGVAQHVDGDTPESWIDSADQALYKAKQAGKDRVERAERATTTATPG